MATSSSNLTPASALTSTPASTPAPVSTFEAQSAVHIPRVAIKFCTQCKWNLRAAYYAQELLQTFSTKLGEIALQPVTGGIFTITLYHPTTSAPVATHAEPIPQSTNPAQLTRRARAPSITIAPTIRETLIWDRKRDNGFPEVKELKSRIRNVIEPDRDLGHIDRSLNRLRKGSAVSLVDFDTNTNTNTSTTGGNGGAIGEEAERGEGNRTAFQTPFSATADTNTQRKASRSERTPSPHGTRTGDSKVELEGEKTPRGEIRRDQISEGFGRAADTISPAAGGESLEFGKNLDSLAVPKTTAGKEEDCEDCK